MSNPSVPSNEANKLRNDVPHREVPIDREDETQQTSGDSGAEIGVMRDAAQVADLSDRPQGGDVRLGERQGMWSSGTGDTSGYTGMTRVIDMPGRVEGRLEGLHGATYQRLHELVPGLRITHVFYDRGELTFFVAREQMAEVARQLRDDEKLRYEVCMSISGVHYPADAGAELHVVYHFLSYTHNQRLRIEVTCPESDPHVPSIVATYPMADFHERETWDMFGVIFDGHPNLTRILMPDDWVGHPQRKDYPLGGVPIEYKGAVVPPPDKRRSYNA